MASRYRLAPRRDAERQDTLFDAPRVRSYRNDTLPDRYTSGGASERIPGEAAERGWGNQ